MTPMYSMDIQWADFRIHLPSFDAWMRENFSIYVGNSADYDLTLWFDSPVPPDQDTAIQSYLASITEAGEAAKFTQDDNLNMAEASAQNSVVSSDIATWIPAERKIFMNMQLTPDDRLALLNKFPVPDTPTPPSPSPDPTNAPSDGGAPDNATTQ